MAELSHASNVPDAFLRTSKRPSPDSAVIGRVEQYMTLHFNATQVCQHLFPTATTTISNILQSPPPVSLKSIVARASPDMSSSEPSSASPSPTLEGQQFSQTVPPMIQLSKLARTTTSSSSSSSTTTTTARKTSRTPPSTMASIPEDTPPNDNHADEELKLYNINLELKSTLTDLLSCESVRHDEKMRMWVQCRLMEAEMELKKHRRRRSSATKSL